MKYCLIFSLISLLSTCASLDCNNGGSSGSDSDADSDSDTDTDTDTVTDADTDTDTASGTDSDTDTGSDSDNYTDTDTNTDNSYGGQLAWAKRAGGSSAHDNGRGISALSDGSCLVTGYFTGTATFGPGEINERDWSSSFTVEVA